MQGKDKDYFAALYDVARAINASLKPSKVLEEIARCVAEAMEVKASSLRLLDSTRERLLWGAAYGLSEGYIRKGTVIVKESGLDQKALAGETIYLKDAQTDPDFQYGEKAKSEGIKSVLVVPLVIEREPIGVLRVYAGQVREFESREVKFLEAAANLSAIAIDNARLHEVIKTNLDLALAHAYRLDDN